jgi:phospholipase/carboxylesterase
MTGATLQRPDVWRPAAARAPLLLHGTGRNEHDLLPLAERLAPAAPVLSVRGTVLEDGMPRFFRQLAEGVFDEDDLRERVGELAEFLIAAAKEYEAGSWTLVGFSNGAIIASALLMLHPETLTAAVLLGAIVSFSAPPDVDLTGKRVRVANGQRDQWLPQRTTALISQLHARGAEAAVLLPTAGARSIRATGRASPKSCKRCTPTTADPLPIACSCSAG